jgi:hypothetical protein
MVLTLNQEPVFLLPLLRIPNMRIARARDSVDDDEDQPPHTLLHWIFIHLTINTAPPRHA